MLIYVVFQIMKGLLEDLKKKVLALRDKYGDIVVEHVKPVHECKNEALFQSMQRWHQQTHMESMNWIALFEKVKKTLEFRDLKFIQPQEVCLSLLKKKYRKNNLKEKLSISDTFPERFLEQIKLFFDEEVNKSCEEFEFDLSKKSREVTFYSNEFLPVAIFSTFKEKFPGVEDQVLFDDCFTLGAGSKRQDLIPEVHAYCDQCCDILAEEKNRIIFRKQVENNFSLHGYFEYTDSENDSVITFEDKNAVRGNESDVAEDLKGTSTKDDIQVNEIEGLSTVFNPWVEEMSEDGSNDVVSALGDDSFKFPVEDAMETKERAFNCELCAKSFSKENFVNLHRSIFHKKRKVVAEYVDEAKELITSFCVESQINEKKGAIKPKSSRVDMRGEIENLDCRRSGRLLTIKKSLKFTE